jgi:hypothetical protein
VEAKANVPLDGQEMSLLIQASIKLSKSEDRKGKFFRSRQFLILADKLADAKEDFHQAQYEVTSKKYDLKNEEKPAIGVADLSGVNDQSTR